VEQVQARTEEGLPMDLTGRRTPSGYGESGRAGPGALPRSNGALTAAICQHRRAVVVINTRSRRGARHFSSSCRQLELAGFHLLGRFPVQTHDELQTALADAVLHQPDLVVVGGGDGTISEAVRHLAYRDLALGILPLGTTNNFARSLGVPLNPTRAVDVLARGQVVEVDLGRVGELMFANMASVGLSSEVAASVPAGLKQVMGRAAYPLTAAARLPAHRPFRARLSIGGHCYELRTHQLNIANGNFHAGLPISRDATAHDQFLLVYTMGGAGRATLVGATVEHAMRGRRRPMSGPPFLVTDSLRLFTDPVLPIDVDGEIVGSTPAVITLAPRALRVMVDRS
jgi:YegS/Rv2252/BmrU family lipid kinase